MQNLLWENLPNDFFQSTFIRLTYSQLLCKTWINNIFCLNLNIDVFCEKCWGSKQTNDNRFLLRCNMPFLKVGDLAKLSLERFGLKWICKLYNEKYLWLRGELLWAQWPVLSGTPVKSEWTALVRWGPKGLKWNENGPYTEAGRQASG